MVGLQRSRILETFCGINARVSSPRLTSSTLITSAPRSASSIVAVGPARTRVRSRIRIFRRGGGIPCKGRLSNSHRDVAQNVLRSEDESMGERVCIIVRARVRGRPTRSPRSEIDHGLVKLDSSGDLPRDPDRGLRSDVTSAVRRQSTKAALCPVHNARTGWPSASSVDCFTTLIIEAETKRSSE